MKPSDSACASKRADLAEWKQPLDRAVRDPNAESAAKLRATVLGTLRHWQQDSDLASVRDIQSLARLLEDEQESLRQLWAEVEKLLR